MFEGIAVVLLPAVCGALAIFLAGDVLDALRVLILQIVICGGMQRMLRRYPMHT